MFTQSKINSDGDWDSRESDNEASRSSSDLKVSRQVHPEDLNAGDDVAVSELIHSLGTFCWCGLDTYQYPPDQPIRLRMLADEDLKPQSVKSICLPYVLCKTTQGTHVVHDLRKTQLVRLDVSYAESVRKAWKADSKLVEGGKKKKKQKNKKKNRKSGK